MKAKVVTVLLLVVALGVFLSGCCHWGAKGLKLDPVYFDFDKATLTPEAKAILKKDIQVLKDNPDVKVNIQGNTCASGDNQYNQNLSERRAAAVEGFLVQGGISAGRLSKVGYGETKLQMAEPNPGKIESAAAKANRRVDLKVK